MQEIANLQRYANAVVFSTTANSLDIRMPTKPPKPLKESLKARLGRFLPPEPVPEPLPVPEPTVTYRDPLAAEAHSLGAELGEIKDTLAILSPLLERVRGEASAALAKALAPTHLAHAERFATALVALAEATKNYGDWVDGLRWTGMVVAFLRPAGVDDVRGFLGESRGQASWARDTLGRMIGNRLVDAGVIPNWFNDPAPQPPAQKPRPTARKVHSPKLVARPGGTPRIQPAYHDGQNTAA